MWRPPCPLRISPPVTAKATVVVPSMPEASQSQWKKRVTGVILTMGVVVVSPAVPQVVAREFSAAEMGVWLQIPVPWIADRRWYFPAHFLMKPRGIETLADAVSPQARASRLNCRGAPSMTSSLPAWSR